MLRFPYTEAEIDCLVENYMEYISLKHKSFILLRLLDLQVAMRQLPMVLREAVVYVGVLNYSIEEAAEYFEVSKSTILRRYANGMGYLYRRLR
jgi:DNA-directed RNA polymerase specialized sigma24 family protein